MVSFCFIYILSVWLGNPESYPFVFIALLFFFAFVVTLVLNIINRSAIKGGVKESDVFPFLPGEEVI